MSTAPGLQTVFVAHADADTEWVEGFLVPSLGLPRERIMTTTDLRPGDAVIDEVQRAVVESAFTILVLTEAFLRNAWASFAEMLSSYAGVVQLRRVLPLLLDDVELPLRLAALVHLDFRDPARWPSQAARLRTELGLPTPTADALPCPYRGLLPFDEDQARFFFGRTDEIEALALRVRHQPLTLLVGPSGCGKSSLLHAGLIPRLRRIDGIVTVATRPAADPIRTLTAAVGANTAASDPVDVSAAVREGMSRDGGQRLVLVVDQFEEALADRPDENLMAVLVALRRTSWCALVLVLRADFYGRLMSSPLWPVRPTEQVAVEPLHRERLREVITAPARAVGAYVDPVLVERLCRDAAPEPEGAALPLLEQTLALLWEHREQALIPLHAYVRLGGGEQSGLSTAVSVHADGLVNTLPSAAVPVARRILVRLVSMQETVPERVLRRRQQLDDLRVDGEDAALFDETLARLTEARLVVVDTVEGTTVVDLAHETLVRHWPTLARWIAESAATEVVRRRIEEHATEWHGRGRRPDLLYRGRRLTEAIGTSGAEAVPLSATATAFLARGRARQRTRRVLTGSAALVTLVLTTALVVPQAQDLWLRHLARDREPTVLLPGGSALLGETLRPVDVPPLLVDRHEVSLGQYRLCVQAGACTIPEEHTVPVFASGPDDWPAVNVTAREAAAYCAWVGRRLPTIAEWERAARGLDGRPYPWGTAPPTPARVNAALPDPRPGLAAVDDPAFAAGQTPEGISHLLGNAEEWTRSVVEPTDGLRAREVGVWDGVSAAGLLAVVGGNYESEVNEAWVATPTDPVGAYEALGFRCVAEAD